MIRTVRRRRAVFGLAGISLLLLLATLATVRPVAAAEEWTTYSMTYRGTAAGREGLVGASGGLVAFSGGPGAVVGRLDAAPSGSAEASSVEPGTMARLVAGQANGAGGPEVDADALTARAEQPGEQAEDSATQAGPQEAGPMTIVGAEAEAAVSSSVSVARSSVGTFRVAGEQGSAESFATAARAWRTQFIDGDGGLAGAQQPRVASSTDALRIEGALGDGRATADTTARELTSTIEVGAARVVVQGALVLEGVVGRATASAAGTDRSAAATMDVGSVTVGGVPVVLDEQGLSVAENQVVAGADVAAANEQLQTILAEAGIEVRLLAAVQQQDDRAARASSGGVAITVTTASNEAVPRNVVGVVVGRGEVTLSAEPDTSAPLELTPVAPVGSSAPSQDTGSSDLSSTPPSTPSSTGSVDVPATAAPEQPAAPAVASPSDGEALPTEEPQVVAAGVTMTRRTAYAGFAAWMLFTSTLPLLGSMLLGQRP